MIFNIHTLNRLGLVKAYFSSKKVNRIQSLDYVSLIFISGNSPLLTHSSIRSISAGELALRIISLICAFCSFVKFTANASLVDEVSPGVKVFDLIAASRASIFTSPSKAAPAALMDNRFALSFSDFFILIKSRTLSDCILFMVYRR